MMGPCGASKPGDDQSMAPVDPVMPDDKYDKAVLVNLVMTDDHRFGHASTVWRNPDTYQSICFLYDTLIYLHPLLLHLHLEIPKIIQTLHISRG